MLDIGQNPSPDEEFYITWTCFVTESIYMNWKTKRSTQKYILPSNIRYTWCHSSLALKLDRDKVKKKTRASPPTSPPI